jgi:hypothetical protein
MNIKQHVIAILVLVTSLIISGCGPGQLFGPTVTPIPTSTPVPPTATFTPIPPTLTVTPVPPTQEPSVLIRLGPGKFGDPLWLEVVEGYYILTSGTTLLTGSAVGVAEDDMTFPPGLTIDVEGGKITLKGTTYPQGTKLLVDPQGNLIQR